MDVKEAAAAYLNLSEFALDGVTPGFKLTELGAIPEDWEVSTVGSEFSIQLGKMLDAEKNVGISKPFLGNRAIQWGRIDPSCIGQIRLTIRDLQRYRLREGDLLVCEGGEVGRAAIWRNELDECYYQKALHRLRPKREYDTTLMLSVLQKHASSGMLQNFVTQTSIAHLPKDKFEDVPIPLPGRIEQKAIAEVLRDADALIESLEQLIAKKRHIKQGTMQALLTGKQRLPSFEKTWSDRVLGDVVDDLKAGVSVNSTKDEPSQEIPCVVKTSAISGGCFISSQSKVIARRDWSRARASVVRNTILISRMNTPDLVGEVAYVDADYPMLFLPDRVWMTRFRPEIDIEVRWLGYLLSSSSYSRLIKESATGTSGSMKNISKSALLSIEISLPCVEEQAAIATVLSDMGTELTELEARLTKTRQLKQGMMQELLTGRIRLV